MGPRRIQYGFPMKKIQGPRLASTSLPSAKPLEKQTPAVKTPSGSGGFPATGWAEPVKRARPIETAHRTETHPRLKLALPSRDPIGSSATRPALPPRHDANPAAITVGAMRVALRVQDARVGIPTTPR